MGRSARKVDSKFGISVTQLSAFRHICVLFPHDITEAEVLTEAKTNIIELHECAIDYPELLPTRHDLVSPVFDDNGQLYKQDF